MPPKVPPETNRRSRGRPASPDEAEPAIRSRHSAHGQDRRNDIVKQAKKLFAERGYAETRMTDIADAVGITKGLLYWYFDSKEALIAEILVDLRERLRAVQRLAFSEIDDPLGQLYVGTVASVHYILKHYRLYSWAPSVGQDPTLDKVSVQSGSVHALDAAAAIAEGQRLGLIRDDDRPEELALAGAGLVDRLCLLAYRKMLAGGASHAADLSARYLINSLAATKEIAADIFDRYSEAAESAARLTDVRR